MELLKERASKADSKTQKCSEYGQYLQAPEVRQPPETKLPDLRFIDWHRGAVKGKSQQGRLKDPKRAPNTASRDFEELESRNFKQLRKGHRNRSFLKLLLINISKDIQHITIG